MSQTLQFDPFAMWKTMYEQTEANWNETIQQTLNKESFSEGMGETLNYYLQFQELAKKMTESYLKQANMPTRGELADVASLIINLEEKVDHLDDRFDEEIAKLDATKEIVQLRRSVANLEKKLDLIIEAVEKGNKQQSASSASPVAETQLKK
ncbi:polyhydroxyalkanoate biosynthesis repressor PhaR [Sporosarcina sp. 179-K 3D1 HS]|uniref:polyhydroxyalkanoate biosynthesis repressor PhaR n=1 Tax=Sporosarcina sp. 179-K 3D1 HS TaxID=3232169 RepID=UPI0039A08448